MMTTARKLSLTLALTAGVAALPGTAGAATLTQDVTGSVLPELSLAVSTPPTPMTFSPSVNGTAATVLAITSTGSWTLAVKDASATTPGKMDKVTCATTTTLGGSLATALAWNDPGAGGTTGSVSGADQTVATGSLISARTITYTQDIGASESVSAADCYWIQLTYTLT